MKEKLIKRNQYTPFWQRQFDNAISRVLKMYCSTFPPSAQYDAFAEVNPDIVVALHTGFTARGHVPIGHQHPAEDTMDTYMDMGAHGTQDTHDVQSMYFMEGMVDGIVDGIVDGMVDTSGQQGVCSEDACQQGTVEENGSGRNETVSEIDDPEIALIHTYLTADDTLPSMSKMLEMIQELQLVVIRQKIRIDDLESKLESKLAS